MKTLVILLLCALSTINLAAQSRKLPSIDLKNLDGITISTDDLLNTGTPVLLIFWKSTNGKCCDNLEDLQNAWTEDLEEKDVHMIAICLDCRGSWTHIKPMVNGKSWKFKVFVDVNGDLKRAMGVSKTPCTILLDKYQNQLCRYYGYCAGAGDYICQKIVLHLANNEQ